MIVQAWGASPDTPVAADYDGDGKTDLAVWCGASGQWLIQRSSDNSTQTVTWGSAVAPYNDVPVPADYDGDGKCDVAVFRRSTGNWFVKLSGNGQTLTRQWGLGTDVPVPADYDGDGLADIAVWRGTEGNWYLFNLGGSGDSQFKVQAWGAASVSDVPVTGDFDSDGKYDLAVWRAPESRWYVLNSADHSMRTQQHGQADDRPMPAVVVR